MSLAQPADWDDGQPVAELDPVRRLLVLAESTPGTVYAERIAAG